MGHVISLHRTERSEGHTPVGGEVRIEGEESQPEKIWQKELQTGNS